MSFKCPDSIRYYHFPSLPYRYYFSLYNSFSGAQKLFNNNNLHCISHAFYQKWLKRPESFSWHVRECLCDSVDDNACCAIKWPQEVVRFYELLRQGRRVGEKNVSWFEHVRATRHMFCLSQKQAGRTQKKTLRCHGPQTRTSPCLSSLRVTAGQPVPKDVP